MPNSPTIVERLLLKSELEANRDEVNDWLRANDIDPDLVLPDWISIETGYSATVIRFRQYKVDEHGKKLKDPEPPDRAWSEVRTVTLQAWLRPTWLKAKQGPEATPQRSVDIDYDCEFATTDPVIGLVSIALVDDTGATYYAINADCDRDALLANSWLMDNVVPTLPLTRGTDGTTDLILWDPDLPDYDKVKPRAQIAAEIRDFVLGTDPAGPRPVRLWADYGAYDHVALCQLFGTMMDLPAGFPMWTHDLRQEIERLGVGDADLPQQQNGQHNALADALHQQHVRRWIETYHVPVRYALGLDQNHKYGALTEAKFGRPLTEAEQRRGGNG